MDKQVLDQYRDKFVRLTYMAGNTPRQTSGHLRRVIGTPSGIETEENGITGLLVTGQQFVCLVADESQQQFSAIREEAIRSDLIVHIEVIDLDHAKRIAQEVAERQELAEAGKKIVTPSSIPQG